tara:strand:- start:41 stop:463 length:423 start_codon:yes stop_codon:yes gene_type:complete
MTITAVDHSAMEVFSIWEERVNNFGYEIIPDSVTRRAYRKGKKLMNSALNAKKRSERFLYTKAELRTIVGLYLKQDNRQWVSENFCKLHPGQQHTLDSIQAVCAQLETMDVTRPLQSKWVVKSLVAEVAHEIAPERFGAA